MGDTQYHNQKGLLEAALFMSSEPMSLDELSKVTGVNSLGYLRGMLLELKDDYAERGIRLLESAQGWSFQVHRDHLDKVANLTPHADIPEGQKRTLALIAYKEPVTQSEVIKIQGNKTYAYIRSLITRGLVRGEKHGRTKMLSLTQEFERYFGEEKERVREQLIEKLIKKGDAPPQEDVPENLNMNQE
ncbi:MAG: SMC-Scp complex subunit ScpB [Candidatus Aenigmatarchaeota archaeon]|nr:MAG: SMC-Scp complex subunit ScpB [Candidatus Aenigmarchaeota archaeon]